MTERHFSFDAWAGSPDDLIKALAWHAVLRTGGLDVALGAQAASAVPLLYVDKNPWGRHLDDASVPRSAAEASAFAVVLDRVRSGTARIAYSSISFGEGVPRDGSPSIGRVVLREVLDLGLAELPLVQHDQRADTDLVAEFIYRTRSISGHDAIHAASALLEGAWYFVTGDDRLLRRLADLYLDWALPCSAETPVSVLPKLEAGAPLPE